MRLGADIGLVCDGCSRRVLLERRELERRIVSIQRPAEAGEGEAAGVPSPSQSSTTVPA